MYRQQKRFFIEKEEDEKFQRRIDYMKEHYESVLESLSVDSDMYEVCPYMCMNKVLVSRYKKVSFPIVSFDELCKIIEEEWDDDN